MIENGNNLTISLDGMVIANSISVSLTTTRDLIFVTTKPTNGFRERIPGERTGSLDFEAYLDWDIDKLDPGTLVQWRFQSSLGAFYGNGYVGSIGYSGGTDSAPTLAGSMETTGEINFVKQQQDVLCVNGETLCIDGNPLTANI